MPTNYKVLGQAAPANTNNADIYTAPSGTQAVVSTIAIANTGLVGASARMYVRVGGATASAANAIFFDVPVPSNSTNALTLGITLGPSDVLTVRSSIANALTFHAFGIEIS
jgi:hypothetical protein